MPTSYVTVYQISPGNFDWTFCAVGLIPLAVAGFLFWGRKHFGWKQPPFLALFFFCLFGMVWTVGVGRAVLLSEWKAYRAFEQRGYRVVQGTVTQFDPTPYEGHRDECFSVQDQRFCYSDYEISPGFKRSASHGGPIREGLPVWIAYWNGRILRLDVANEQLLSGAQAAAVEEASQKSWQQRMANDPMEQRLTAAFHMAIFCWLLWANLQWRRALRFWAKPPYKPWQVWLCRSGFALGLASAAWRLCKAFVPIPHNEILATLQLALAVALFIGSGTALTLWRIARADHAEGRS